MRADAQRNRARVLAAADEVFSSAGTSASTEEIARRAGVGIGTVFRHFPSKEALVEALLVQRVGQIAEQAEALCDAADPTGSLLGFVAHLVEESAEKKAYVDALGGAGAAVSVATTEAGRRAHAALEGLLRQAQEAGGVRRDVGADDLVGLVVGIARAAEHASWDPGARDRALRVLFDGLRTGP